MTSVLQKLGGFFKRAKVQDATADAADREHDSREKETKDSSASSSTFNPSRQETNPGEQLAVEPDAKDVAQLGLEQLVRQQHARIQELETRQQAWEARSSFDDAGTIARRYKFLTETELAEFVALAEEHKSLPVGMYRLQAQLGAAISDCYLCVWQILQNCYVDVGHALHLSNQELPVSVWHSVIAHLRANHQGGTIHFLPLEDLARSIAAQCTQCGAGPDHEYETVFPSSQSQAEHMSEMDQTQQLDRQEAGQAQQLVQPTEVDQTRHLAQRAEIDQARHFARHGEVDPTQHFAQQAEVDHAIVQQAEVDQTQHFAQQAEVDHIIIQQAEVDHVQQLTQRAEVSQTQGAFQSRAAKVDQIQQQQQDVDTPEQSQFVQTQELTPLPDQPRGPECQRLIGFLTRMLRVCWEMVLCDTSLRLETAYDVCPHLFSIQCDDSVQTEALLLYPACVTLNNELVSSARGSVLFVHSDCLNAHNMPPAFRALGSLPGPQVSAPTQFESAAESEAEIQRQWKAKIRAEIQEQKDQRSRYLLLLQRFVEFAPRDRGDGLGFACLDINQADSLATHLAANPDAKFEFMHSSDKGTIQMAQEWLDE